MDYFNLFTAAAVVIIAVIGAFPVARWLGTDRLLAGPTHIAFDPYRTMNDIISLADVQDRNGPEALVAQANGLRNPVLARAVRGITQVSSANMIRAYTERELFAPLTPATPQWVSVITSPLCVIPVGLFCLVGAATLLTGATIGAAPVAGLGLLVAAGLYGLFMAQSVVPAGNASALATREMLNRLVIIEGVTALAECQSAQQIRTRLAALFPESETATPSQTESYPLRRAA